MQAQPRHSFFISWTMLRYLALAIPLLVAIIVGVSYLQKGRMLEAEYQELVTTALNKFEQARSVEPTSAFSLMAEANTLIAQAEQIKSDQPAITELRTKMAEEAEVRIRQILKRSKMKINFERISERPPMKERQINQRLARTLTAVADDWDIPLTADTSLWPSIGGLVHGNKPVICGLGPAARDLYTPQECVSRTGLIQRTLLVTQVLAKNFE